MPSIFRRASRTAAELPTTDTPLRRHSHLVGGTVEGAQGVAQGKENTRRSSSITQLAFLHRRKSVATATSIPKDQPGCLLLARLPYELRELIYIALVGNDQVDNDEDDREEGSVGNNIDNDDWIVPLKEVSRDPHWRKKIKKEYRRRLSEAHCSEYSALLNLSRTCRLIHYETQPLLLRRIHLHSPSQYAFEAFTFRIPDALLTQIRHLQLHARFPYLLFHQRDDQETEAESKADQLMKSQYFDAKNWTVVVRALNQMVGLWTLRIDLVARDYRDVNTGWPDRPSRRLLRLLLDPLLDVKWCKIFVIETSWPVEGLEIDGAPFELRQREKKTLTNLT